MSDVEYLHSEQFSYLNDEVLHVLRTSDGVLTIAKENTKTDEWQYTNDSFSTLKVAIECFDKLMEKAPSNTTEVEALGLSKVCGA